MDLQLNLVVSLGTTSVFDISVASLSMRRILRRVQGQRSCVQDKAKFAGTFGWPVVCWEGAFKKSWAPWSREEIGGSGESETGRWDIWLSKNVWKTRCLVWIGHTRLWVSAGMDNTSGFTGNGQNIPSARSDMIVRDECENIAVEFPRYGYRRIAVELQRRGYPVQSSEGLLRLMQGRQPLVREESVLNHRPQTRITKQVYLVAESQSHEINQLWVAGP